MALIAAFFGFLIPGLGQIINGQNFKGITVMLVWIAGVAATFFYFEGFYLQTIATIIVHLFFALFSAIDAFIFNPREKEFVEKAIQEFEKTEMERTLAFEKTVKKIRKNLREELEKTFGTKDFEIVKISKIEGKWIATIKVQEKEFEIEVTVEGKIVQS
jgi:TM2 domain-containing membrane protein YozV